MMIYSDTNGVIHCGKYDSEGWCCLEQVLLYEMWTEVPILQELEGSHSNIRQCDESTT